MFMSKTAFTSDRLIPLAISSDIGLSPHHDFSRSRTPGDHENPLSDAGVLGENLPPLAERPPPGRRRISCCRRPRPGSARSGRSTIVLTPISSPDNIAGSSGYKLLNLVRFALCSVIEV